MTVRAAIGLGSNLGDRLAHLRAAVAALGEIGEIAGISDLYETEPIGGSDQDPYLNGAAALDTRLSARSLLDRCLAIEAERGRERRERWGPRTLDLDLLLYGGDVINEPGLTVPHPRLSMRRFALQPLVDAWPDATLPDGTTVVDLLAGVADQAVERVASGQWWLDAGGRLASSDSWEGG